MPAAARKDDAIACGSKINAGSGDVNINGKAAARKGDAGIEAGFSAHLRSMKDRVQFPLMVKRQHVLETRLRLIRSHRLHTLNQQLALGQVM